MCYRPHPAPMRRQRRSPVLLSAARPLPGPALTGPWPTVTRSQGACHAAPPSLPRAAARSHRAPSPEYRPAAARTHWARLVRIAPTACRRPHRIYPTACRHPHPPMSPPSRFRAHRPPHHDHRAPPPSYTCCASTPASHPPCADLRVTPPISLLALRRPRGPGWQEPHRMHPFFAECAKKAPFLATSARNACFSRSRWQHPRPMHPFPGAIGRFGIHGARLLPPRALFASRSPKSRMARRCCQRRPAFPRQRHAVRRNGLCALRRGPGLLAACTPPCHLACARRGLRSGRTGFAPCSRASPSETRHAVPVPMHLATCAPHPSRQPRAPTASRKQAEQRKQLNAGIKIGSPNGDPIEEFFGFAQRLPDALQPLHQANELALSYLDHSTRQRLGGYVIGLSGNSFTVDLYAALVDHATSIAR